VKCERAALGHHAREPWLSGTALPRPSCCSEPRRGRRGRRGRRDFSDALPTSVARNVAGVDVSTRLTHAGHESQLRRGSSLSSNALAVSHENRPRVDAFTRITDVWKENRSARRCLRMRYPCGHQEPSALSHLHTHYPRGCAMSGTRTTRMRGSTFAPAKSRVQISLLHFPIDDFARQMRVRSPKQL
jgi:hypothetical protein